MSNGFWGFFFVLKMFIGNVILIFVQRDSGRFAG